MKTTPDSGFKGLVQNWQSDLLAAVSVSLVALPLGLGIALAAGMEPIAGVYSAIIGGLVTSFFRSSHLSINGPTAGLIAVILASIVSLNDGSENVLNYVTAAFVMSGALQVLLGVLKLGRLADLFHSTVIHGLLAAIGIIIIAKQIHLAMGTTSSESGIVETLIDAVKQVPNMNPFVMIISLLGLLLLVYHSRLSFKIFHLLPAPMWVLMSSIIFVYLFNFLEPHQINIFGYDYQVGPKLLINIPDNIFDAIIFPDFSKITTFPFWVSVISITLIASIESLAATKAIDKLDPYKRKSDLNKDLTAIGLSTMIAGAVGALPIINVIVRSTVNIHAHAKTKWSNFFHGLLLLVFIFLLAPAIQKVPLAALAIILVYTGYKMASPIVFKHVHQQGIEQLLFFIGTIVITLYTNLLVGLFGGMLLVLVTHMLLAKVPVKDFLRMVFKNETRLEKVEENKYNLNFEGIANFLNTLKIDKLLKQIPEDADVEIDLSNARLVDFSIMDHLFDFKKARANSNGSFRILGLENHISSSKHNLALKIQTHKLKKLSNRQSKLKEIAEKYNWNFQLYPNHLIDYIRTFYFFNSRPIDECFNSIFGKTENVDWEVFDVSFDEGAFEIFDEYKTTLGIIKFPFSIPKFSIEKKDITERYLHLSEHKDIDYYIYYNFHSDFLVKVENKDKMLEFVNDEFKSVIENGEIVHHIESNGEAILLFTDNLRFAKVSDYVKFIEFTIRLKMSILNNQNNLQALANV